jgi:hypothetical protein
MSLLPHLFYLYILPSKIDKIYYNMTDGWRIHINGYGSNSPEISCEEIKLTKIGGSLPTSGTVTEDTCIIVKEAGSGKKH